MEPTPNHEVTQLLAAAEAGDPGAAEALLPLVYDELRRLARARMRNEPPGQTLQPTALVHEAFLRLVGPGQEQAPAWNGRGHFFGAAAQAMHRILVERARHNKRLKRGGGAKRVPLDDGVAAAAESDGTDLVALNDALDKLTAHDPRKAEVVALRYFGGLTIEETAAALGLSTATVKNEWTYARTWLHREMSRQQPGAAPAGPDQDGSGA